MARATDLGSAGDGVAPQQLITSMCERQVQTLVSATVARWPVSRLPMLRSWALEATAPMAQELLRTLGFEAIVCTQTLRVERICTERTAEAILETLFAEDTSAYSTLFD